MTQMRQESSVANENGGQEAARDVSLEERIQQRLSRIVAEELKR